MFTPRPNLYPDQSEIDRFNGIFYKVIPSDGYVQIVFPKLDLYSMFVDSLCKELRAIVDNKDKKVFITHVRGLRCVLTCNIADNTIVVTGQGHRLWKETAFIR